jgi:hypothetical protein
MTDPFSLRGKSYTFEDGNKIEVVQVVRRDDGLMVTFNTSVVGHDNIIPRKNLMLYEEFVSNYGHLFGLTK